MIFADGASAGVDRLSLRAPQSPTHERQDLVRGKVYFRTDIETTGRVPILPAPSGGTQHMKAL